MKYVNHPKIEIDFQIGGSFFESLFNCQLKSELLKYVRKFTFSIRNMLQKKQQQRTNLENQLKKNSKETSMRIT